MRKTTIVADSISKSLHHLFAGHSVSLKRFRKKKKKRRSKKKKKEENIFTVLNTLWIFSNVHLRASLCIKNTGVSVS